MDPNMPSSSTPTPPVAVPQTQGTNMNYVGFGRRLVAALIDIAIYWPLAYVGIIIIGMISAISVGGATNNLKDFALNFSIGGYIYSIVLVILYFVVLQNKLGGQTPGKKVMAIKVVNENGQVPSLMTFTVRELFVKNLTILIPALGLLKTLQGLVAIGILIGFLMVLWDGKKQALHDKIAKTFVVRV